MKLGPRGSRRLLLAWITACFAFSAVKSAVVLAAALAVVAVVFRRQALQAAKRTLVSAVPVTLALVASSFAYVRLVTHTTPPWPAYLALALRATLLAFLTFAVLQNVSLLSALAPWPTLSRLLVITLAQVHALRLLATESLLGLRSRLVRKPRIMDGIRRASGLSAALFTLSHRNAREISDALRSRGF
jgi:cobalt/nickel transport system permease protein